LACLRQPVPLVMPLFGRSSKPAKGSTAKEAEAAPADSAASAAPSTADARDEQANKEDADPDSEAQADADEQEEEEEEEDDEDEDEEDDDGEQPLPDYAGMGKQNMGGLPMTPMSQMSTTAGTPLDSTLKANFDEQSPNRRGSLMDMTLMPRKKDKEPLSLEDRHAKETKQVFIQFLRHRRGTTFRAWRLDIDRRNTNRVSYTDLMDACRHLGLSLNEARLVWRAFRPVKKGCPATPIEFHEFDPVEWTNLNVFLEVLWQELNFDLDLFWDILTQQKKGDRDAIMNACVSLAEFDTAMKRLGFEGESQLIYYGLDTSGQGRLWKQELQYLKFIPPESHSHPEDSPLVKELKSWVNKTHRGDVNRLLHKMGLRHGGSSMSTTSLAHQLRRLGFPGDPLHTAMTCSRCNHHVCMDDLVELLQGHERCRGSMSYAGRHQAFQPAARRKLASDTSSKPAWDSTVWSPIALNSLLCSRERHYFSGPFHRPVRDGMKKDLDMRMKARQLEDE